MSTHDLLIFAPLMIAAWLLFTYFWPSMLLSVFKRAFLARGFGDGPVPVNSIRVEGQQHFAQPVTSETTTGANPMTTGVNHDTLLSAAWLDLSKGPQVLHVPEMDGRYYAVQLTDPSRNTNFAYVGKRTTGTHAGDYLISGPRWKGEVPAGLEQIVSPNKAVMLIGRVLVRDEADVSTAHALFTQIQLTPLVQWQPGD